MKEYNLSDTSDSATAIIAYTIRAMNNCGFSKMQVDRYIKNIKSLSYNELVDLSNSILSSCNDYIKDLYNDANDEDDMDKKLEARIARLEKLIKNEVIDSNSNLEYISDDIERGLKRELGVNTWNISAKPMYNKRWNDNYVEVNIEGSGHDVPNECVGIFKVYKLGKEYRLAVVDKNRHIGSLDNLDEVVSMISDIMTIRGEDFYG